MFRRVLATATLGILTAVTIGAMPSIASAATRHAATGFGREPGLAIGAGHGIATERATNVGASHTFLTIPAPEAIRERQNAKAIENAPSTAAPVASPAVKATHDPFPDFNVPLRRHRMALPDSAIPAMGDLSF